MPMSSGSLNTVRSSLLKKSFEDQQPLYISIGTPLLFLIFLSLLTGRFTLDRLGAGFPDLDLRLLLAYVIAVGFMIWFGASFQHLPKRYVVPGGGFFLLWAGWLVLSSLWAPAEARIEPAILDLCLLVFFVVTGWVLLIALPSETTSRIWTWMLVAGVVYFALAIASGPGLQGRYAAPGGGPNVFVRVMVLAAVASLYVSIARRKTWPLMCVPVFVIGAALSGSRGGILSAAVMLLMFVIPISRRLGTKKVVGIALGGGVAAALIAGWNGGQVVNYVQERYVRQTLIEGYSSGRDTISDHAFALYEANPLIGYGVDGYYAVMPQYEYAHNLVLSTAAETGSVGLILLLLSLLRFTILTKRHRPISLIVLTAMAAGVYLTLASLYSGDYYDSRFLWFFFGWAAIESQRKRSFSESEPCPIAPSSIS